ncbi:MAG: GMC family oxidoreductase [Roseitalea sp.]|jgi:choline dehydrogenase-like flavoprotein|nr:GMC family oxidoreductase [Roseitalea sp.]MBO6720325.1 GMC family oxidoreductase [Roseitalea sp.]MBO6742685.1 GMC family oxidoreductase [Roseitalea sp.]
MSGATHTDALVVGAGPSGAVVAGELIRAGISVTILEQGDWVPADAFDGARRQWELTQLRKWHPNPNTRGRPEDYPVDVGHSDVNPLMFAGVGGAALIYGAHWMRFMPSDFRVRTLDAIAEDWPFTYDDLAPFYAYVEEAMGVSGQDGNPAYPDGAPTPLPALPIGKVGRKAAKGMNRLGWHWWPGSNAIPSRPWRALQPCVLRGTCGTGCSDGAKATPDRTHWPDAIKAGARLVTGARAAEVTLDARGRASGAIWIDRTGTRHEATADVVILCANGIGTPRILHMSDGGAGIANRSGMVGRRLMMHPFAAVMGTFDEDLESWVGPAGQILTSMQFYETDASRGFLRGAKWNCMPAGGPQSFRAGYGDGPLTDAWGLNLHENVRQKFGRSFEWGIVGEDLPDPENRVSLSDSLTDTDGLPAPAIHYRVSDNTRKMLDFHIARAVEAMEAAGAIETAITPLIRDCGWHLMGTAMMGDDPETSVVDAHGRCHDVPNLYVMDASTFPTSSGMNPTATIMAVAARSVLHLIEHRTDVERAA